jgi:hypothetical protein
MAAAAYSSVFWSWLFSFSDSYFNFAFYLEFTYDNLVASASLFFLMLDLIFYFPLTFLPNF